jgi:hypothetical protein
MILVQSGLKHGDALLQLLFNFALECVISKVQENQVGLKLNGTRHLLVYVDYINLLEGIINTTNKNTRRG